MKLDIGCGQSKREGFVGIDILDFECVDIVHDINKLPFPFEDNSVDEIVMDNVLEHLIDPIKTLEELYRICKNSATLHIHVPYFRSFYSTIDPTHRNFFGVNYFNYFDPTHVFQQKYQYFNAKFIVKEITFDMEWSNSKNILHRFIKYVANKRPYTYEARLSHLYPLNSLYFKLEILK